MNDRQEKALNLFTTRLRQLILQYGQLKKENEALRAAAAEKDSAVKTLEARLRQSDSDYRSLKNARLLTVSTGDAERAKKDVAALIRDVDRCIALLSGGDN